MERFLSGVSLYVAHKIIATILTSKFFTALVAVVHLFSLQMMNITTVIWEWQRHPVYGLSFSNVH